MDIELCQEKINTLNSLLPQGAPFVTGQISEAVSLLSDNSRDKMSNALDLAILITEQVNKYSEGVLLYNYTPILITLLSFLPDGVDLSKFDTIDHKVLVGVAKMKQFMSTYADRTKTAAIDIVQEKDNYSMLLCLLAGLLQDIKNGKNVLNIAYIIQSLNISKIQFVNGVFKFYCDILAEIKNATF